MHVIPAPGLLVPDPEQRGTPGYHLPPEGRKVEPSLYWQRRLSDRDVTLAPAETRTAEQPQG